MAETEEGDQNQSSPQSGAVQGPALFYLILDLRKTLFPSRPANPLLLLLINLHALHVTLNPARSPG